MLSQEYCPGLVEAIVDGLYKTAFEVDPGRFHQPPQEFIAFAVDNFNVDEDLDKWQNIFDSTEALFRRTSHKTIVLSHSDPLWREIEKLVPWHSIERIQLALQPALHRFPTHVPHTHRGSALLYNDGTRQIVSEDLGDLRFPKGRFHKPVNIGIFWFGMALSPDQLPEPSQPAPGPPHPEDDPLKRADIRDSDIAFKNSINYGADLKTLVARMHRNLGHPPSTELKKLMAMNGISSQKVLSAVDDLVCASCLRTRPPPKPAPASMPRSNFRQFADEIQLDIVYIRDVAGNNYPVLGIIDECTHLHQACLLESRFPEEITRQFIRTWAQPFGFPLVCRLDADGSFRGAFEEYLDTTGTFTDYVPPEAHYRMGLVERHNATLRSIAERIIDAHGIVGPEQMEQVIAATTFSKNACTWSSGRPPFIAAFGRIPRHGGLDLLSDQHGLATGGTREHMQQLADSLRAEAQQQIAAMNVDSSFRRSMLRKAKPTPEDEYVIGDTLAYWRWTARSGRKRGGYKLARMLGFDPDGKSLWVQSGTNTIKLAREQARKAYGFEAWHPDPADLRALRTASDNIKKGIFEDETLPVADDPYQELGNDDNLKEVEPDFMPPVFTPVPDPLLEQLSQVRQQPDSVQPDQGSIQPQLPNIQQSQSVTQQHQHITIEVTSPTYNQQNILQQQQNNTFGMTAEQLRRPTVRTPVRRAARSRTPNRATPNIRDEQQHAHNTPAIGTGADTPPLPAVPAEHTETVEISDTEPELGQQVPTTPEALAQQAHQQRATGSSDTSRQRQDKRPGEPLPDATRKRDMPEQAQQASAAASAIEPAQPAEKSHSALTANNVTSTDFYSMQTANTVVGIQQHTSPKHCRAFRTAQQAPMQMSDEGITLNNKHFDGTTDIYMPHASTTCFKAYKASAEYQGDGMSDDSDASQEDMSSSKPQLSPLTRQQQKALDKELPWRVIVRLPG